MTEDAICSIRFKLIPIGDSFCWGGSHFTKIAERFAKVIATHQIEEPYMQFPLEFKVDISMTHAEQILGPQTEPGAWGNPEE